jgi:hypothetical protein
MNAWLLPICLYWPLAAGYLGGFPVEVRSTSGLRQILSIIASYILFGAVWGLLHKGLASLGGPFWQLVVPTLVTMLGLPLILRVGHLILGIRLVKGEVPH